MSFFGSAWDILMKVQRLVEGQEAQGAAIKAFAAQLTDLERRVHRLELREELVVTESKAAARAASYEATQGVVSDLSRRLGVLEQRGSTPPKSRRIRLEPPDPG